MKEKQQEPDVELRDIFAMQSMRVVNTPEERSYRSANTKSLAACKVEFANHCYELADLMMEARKK